MWSYWEHLVWASSTEGKSKCIHTRIGEPLLNIIYRSTYSLHKAEAATFWALSISQHKYTWMRQWVRIEFCSGFLHYLSVIYRCPPHIFIRGIILETFYYFKGNQHHVIHDLPVFPKMLLYLFADAAHLLILKWHMHLCKPVRSHLGGAVIRKCQAVCSLNLPSMLNWYPPGHAMSSAATCYSPGVQQKDTYAAKWNVMFWVSFTTQIKP